MGSDLSAHSACGCRARRTGWQWTHNQVNGLTQGLRTSNLNLGIFPSRDLHYHIHDLLVPFLWVERNVMPERYGLTVFLKPNSPVLDRESAIQPMKATEMDVESEVLAWYEHTHEGVSPSDFTEGVSASVKFAVVGSGHGCC